MLYEILNVHYNVANRTFDVFEMDKGECVFYTSDTNELNAWLAENGYDVVESEGVNYRLVH